MKLAELGLKTKPQTKYFDGGYVSFSTENQELSFEVMQVTKNGMYSLDGGRVPSKEFFEQLMTMKNIKEYEFYV